MGDDKDGAKDRPAADLADRAARAGQDDAKCGTYDEEKAASDTPEQQQADDRGRDRESRPGDN